MAFNGSGTFNRNTGIYTGATCWQQTRDVSRPIRADDHDTHDQDIAGGLSNVICKDGQTTVTANLPMAGFRHLNVGSGAARTDYLRLDQFQDRTVVHCGTSGGSANAQTISATPAPSAYIAGQLFSFVAGFTNTGNTTLNINSLGARTLALQGVGQIYPGALVSGGTYLVLVTGADIRLLNPHQSVQTYVPTVTFQGGGSGTLNTLQNASYIFVGPYVVLDLLAFFTVNSGTVNAVRFTLPITPVSLGAGGAFVSDGGVRGACYYGAAGSTLEIARFDGAGFAVASGRQVACQAIFRWI